MDKKWFVAGCVQAALAVALGAFGAHALEGVLTESARDTYVTATRYHMFHALGLFMAAWAASAGGRPRFARAAGWLFTAGIVLFSGSLYVLAPTGFSPLGAVAPIGGTCFVAGWAALALSRRNNDKS